MAQAQKLLLNRPPALMTFHSLYPNNRTGNIYGTYVTDPYSLAEWNAFFGLSSDFENEPWTNGPAFTSIEVYGNSVDLIGPGGLLLGDMLFFIDDNANPSWSGKLKSFNDRLGMFTSAGDDCFGFSNFVMNFRKQGINFPAMTSVGAFCFEYGTGGTVNLPLLTTYGSGAFYSIRCSEIRLDSLTDLWEEYTFDLTELKVLYLPSLTTLADYSLPSYFNEGPFTLTIPAALMTVNGGNPHAEIQRLIDEINVPLTIIQV